VVLYEMSTGIQAFGGSTQAIVFDAILNRTPHPISHINPSIPPRLESLITTSLEKERELRHQHASDLEAELKRIRRDLESASPAPTPRPPVPSAADRRPASTPSTPPAIPAPAAKGRTWIWITAGALVVLALGYGGFSLWSDTESQQVAVTTPPAQTPGAPPVEV